MFIQGNIQIVFDALYEMGVINPTLKADWKAMENSFKSQPNRWREMIQVVNHSGSNVQTLIKSLNHFKQEDLLFLAMEVARELVEYEDRKVLH